MGTNDTNKNQKLIYPELSYTLTGLCFEAHNTLGRYAREIQYGNCIEEKLKTANIPHKREFRVGDTGNVLDFLIDDKIVLEIKAKQ